MIGWRRFVDRLHQAAGSREVIDLHGRLDLVRCLACTAALRRADFQNDLTRLNATWADFEAAALPDGDAELDQKDFSSFVVPDCPSCGGTMKPDVVFFGENVPRGLMVFSGFRFGIPIAAVNLGRTRADDLLLLRSRTAARRLSRSSYSPVSA